MAATAKAGGLAHSGSGAAGRRLDAGGLAFRFRGLRVRFPRGDVILSGNQ
jgi:hypothetical protein